MEVIDVRKQSQLYGHTPTGAGLKAEGRGMYDDNRGSLQPPSFLIKEQEVKFLGWVQVQDPYLGVVKARKFEANNTTWIDIRDRLTENPKRLGTIAFWIDSSTEQLRKSMRMQTFISQTKIFSDLKELALEYKISFLECLLIYYVEILSTGDFSFDQFIRDLKDKEDSSSPFRDVNPRLKKNRDVLADPELKTIYAREVKEEKSELEWLIEHLRLAIDGKYEFKCLDPNFLINALRSRPVDLTIVVETIESVLVTFEMYRARCAGGVVRVSRLSWPIWHTKMKKVIMEKIFSYLSTKFNLMIHSLDTESVQFYIGAAEKKISCYDVSNAEKTWGCVFYPNLPGIVDFSDTTHFNIEFSPALQSGVDITRLINIFGVLLIIQWLRKKGRLSKEKFDLWAGGDNFGFTGLKLEKPAVLEGEGKIEYLVRLITEEDGLWHIIDEDDRILGFRPADGRLGGLHFNIDGVDSMVAWNPAYNVFKWRQTRQKLTRVLDSVIQLDLYQKGTCLKFYKWIKENNILDETEEIYNHDDLWRLSSSILLSNKDVIKDGIVSTKSNVELLFPGLVEWCQASFLVDDSVTGKFVVDSDASLSWEVSSTW